MLLRGPRSVGMTAKAPHQSWAWFTLFRSLDAILRVIELESVPQLGTLVLAHTVDELVRFSEGPSVLNPKVQREGVVRSKYSDRTAQSRHEARGLEGVLRRGERVES